MLHSHKRTENFSNVKHRRASTCLTCLKLYDTKEMHSHWGLCYVRVNFLTTRQNSGHRKARVLKETRKALVASTVQWEPTRTEASTRLDKYTALCPLLSYLIIGSHCRFFKWPRKVHWLDSSSSNFLVCWPIFGTKSRGVDCQLACSRKPLCRRWGLQFCTAYAASSFTVCLQQRSLLFLPQAPRPPHSQVTEHRRRRFTSNVFRRHVVWAAVKSRFHSIRRGCACV